MSKTIESILEKLLVFFTPSIDPSIRYVECQTIESMELGGTSRSNLSVRHSQQFTARSDANCIDGSDSGK